MEAAGADSPWLTALVLLEHATGFDRVQVLAHPDRPLTDDQVGRFRALVERRCRREPLAYILGYREFFGRRFRVTRDVLVPRPETEGLVAHAFDRMDGMVASSDGPEADHPVLVDVGTGSGAIAVTLLAERPAWTGIGTDADPAALRVARANARAHGVADRLRLVACELAEGIERPVPLVVANLPYVPTREIDALEPEVARFEPRLALDGGPDGISVIAAFINALSDLLLPGGSAIFEMGEGQGAALKACAREALPGSAVSLERDAAGIERYVVIERAG